MLTLIKSHKIAMKANDKQRQYFAKASGTARFAYNWALAAWNAHYEAGRKCSEASLRRELNAVKREKYPWMYEVSKCAPQLAIMNLGEAYKNFFAKRTDKPRFKKKGFHDSFALSNDQFRLEGKRISIPNLGWVRLREALRFQGKILSAAISREAGRWSVSIAVECEVEAPLCESQAVVGVDLGLKTFAVLSSGQSLTAPKPHRALGQRLALLSRGLSRKQKGSHNRNKAKSKLAKLHARIKHIREDALHKATTYLVQNFGVIVLENLNVSGMMKNHKLARALADVSFSEFRRQIEYKARRAGVLVIIADRWFASSKLCSKCGEKNLDLTLKDRYWTCKHCHTEHERDFNAACNLKIYFEWISTASSTGIDACREDFFKALGNLGLREASSKQEFNVKSA